MISVRRIHRVCLPLLAFLFFAFLSVGQNAVGQDAKEVSAPVGKLDLKDGDSIVFLGDSITHQCLYTQYVDRVKQHTAAALKIEDQIFQANQPKPRKYVLKRVASAPKAASKK